MATSSLAFVVVSLGLGIRSSVTGFGPLPHSTPAAARRSARINDQRTHASVSSDGDLGSETTTSQRALQEALQRSMQSEAPSWLLDLEATGLPFACTSCGKCCRTEGDVYLAPEDIVAASRLLDMTSLEFVEQYASHYLSSSTDAASATTNASSDQATTTTLQDLLQEDKLWVRLQEKNGACVFLHDETNHCGIYEARPAQCRTYPFWPSILKSPSTWNAECRRPDNDDERNDGTTDSLLPLWTAEAGGCEGMKLLESPSAEEEESVPIREASQQLQDYVLADRRFPDDAKEMRISGSSTDPASHANHDDGRKS